jgi:hypothetical protein
MGTMNKNQKKNNYKKKDDYSSCSDSDNSDDGENKNGVKGKKKNKKKDKYSRYPSISDNVTHSVKLGVLSFVFYILVMSDVFIERVMSKVSPQLVEGRVPTRKGICVQGVLLIIGIIIIDIMIAGEKL